MEPDEEEGKNKIIVAIFIAAVVLISGAIYLVCWWDVVGACRASEKNGPRD